MNTVFVVWLAVGCALLAAGLAAWATQVRKGLGVTSLSQRAPWGLYIAGFIFFMGLSAGALVLAAVPVLLDLGDVVEYAPLTVFVAIVALLIASLFILADIGRPDRAWRMLRHPRLRSPMVWDLLLTVVCGVVGVGFLVALLADAPAVVVQVLAVLALIAGIADGVSAFVFATQVSRDVWHSAVQPISFAVGAVATAAAVLLLFMIGLRPTGYVELDNEALAPLSLGLAGTVALGLMLVGGALVSTGFHRSARSRAVVREALSSRVLRADVAAGSLAVVLLLVPAVRASTAGLAVAAALALVHLALKRVHFVSSGFAVSPMGAVGVDLDAGRRTTWRPVEAGVILGLAGAFIVPLALGLALLPLGA